jgi:uncharacterized protein YndB with AHSA1/START domain
MASLLPRTIDWIDSAPLRIEARAESAGSPQAVFEVLADHERWPEWFPSVRKVTVLGPAAGVGARRRVAVPGATVEEEFIVWEPGARWSFTSTTARPRFVTSLVEDCILEELEGGRTAITYTMYLEPAPAFRPLLKRVKRRLESNNRRAMANLARRAEGERGPAG